MTCQGLEAGCLTADRITGMQRQVGLRLIEVNVGRVWGECCEAENISVPRVERQNFLYLYL